MTIAVFVLSLLGGMAIGMPIAYALLLCGALAPRLGGRWLTAAAALFAVGVLLFSGSLYALTLIGSRGLGIITPIGGTAWLLGWLALAVAAWRAPRPISG